MILLTFRHHNLCSHNNFLANTNEAKEPFPCRSLVSQLEEVDPRKMKHEEKLAFWINVHNALIMHVNSYSQETLNLMLLFFLFCLSLLGKPTHLLSIVQQAFLVYGIPQNNLNRMSVLLKVSITSLVFSEGGKMVYKLLT